MGLAVPEAVQRLLIASVLLTLAVPLLEAARLYMLKVLVDEVLVPKDLDPFIWVAAAIIGFTLSVRSGQLFRRRMSQRWSGRDSSSR